MDSNHAFFNPAVPHQNMLSLGNLDLCLQGERTAINVGQIPRKRAFVSPPNLFLDGEYYVEQLPDEKRRLTPEQVNVLEKSFEEENRLEPKRKTELAKKLGMRPRQVAVWFQNRKARWKTQRLETDYALLKSSYDSLISNCESVLKENHKLKSKVVSLTRKLQAIATTTEPATDQAPQFFPTAKTTHASDVQFNAELEDSPSFDTTKSTMVDDHCFSDVFVATDLFEEPFRLWVWS